MTRNDFLRALGLVTLGAAAAQAQTQTPAQTPAMPMDHGAMKHGDMPMGTPVDGSPSTAAFVAANQKMHAAMDIDYTGNADIDFARGMIAHHQGAIDMAQVVLEYGKDPEIRALAEGVISAQQQEIAFLQAWLARNGG